MIDAKATSEMLRELSRCAHRMGMAFAAEQAEAEDHARRAELFQLFDRCFFSVRVAASLQLRLLNTPAQPRAEAEVEREEAADRGDPPEAEAPERGERADYDRDRDRETATLPVLLRTLEGVCADAVALPGPPPADLPTLRELLTHMGSKPKAPSSPAPKPDLRRRLAGSATFGALKLAPSPPPRAMGATAPRRATGPPGR